VLVTTSGPERVAGEVQVILVELREIGCGRPDLHEVYGIPRASKGDRWLVEEEVDVQRDVRLTGSALLCLLDEPDHRCVPFRERCLVTEGG
jgi:hypothetical protein